MARESLAIWRADLRMEVFPGQIPEENPDQFSKSMLFYYTAGLLAAQAPFTAMIFRRFCLCQNRQVLARERHLQNRGLVKYSLLTDGFSKIACEHSISGISCVWVFGFILAFTANLPGDTQPAPRQPCRRQHSIHWYNPARPGFPRQSCSCGRSGSTTRFLRLYRPGAG